MKRLCEFIKKNKLTILLFALVFSVTLYSLVSYESLEQKEYNKGEEFTYGGYVETIDGKYIGDILGDLFDGIGQFTFDTGEIYLGEWDDSTISGEGKMIFKDIGEYSGSYEDSKRSGKGEFKWNNGDVYSGNWENDKINGKGEYVFSNGSYVKGDFLDNMVLSGTYYVTEEEYSCKFEIDSSKFTGKIELKLKSGERYEGMMSEGKLNGYGEIKYSNGDTYKGNFKNNRKDGYGTYKWAKGSSYEGSWSGDTMNGEGVFYYTTYSTPNLKGKFVNGAPSGKCIYNETSTVKYITTWQNGKCIRVAEE